MKGLSRQERSMVNIIEKVYGRPIQNREDDLILDLGLTDMQIVSIISGLESKFNISINEEDLLNLTEKNMSVNGLMNEIKNYIN